MLLEPIKREELPKGSYVFMTELHEGDITRGILFEVDEGGVFSVHSIGEGSIRDIVREIPHSIQVNTWLPVEYGPSIRYLQPDELSLAEAAEAGAYIPITIYSPLPKHPDRLTIEAIQAALGTKVEGDDLVSIVKGLTKKE